MLKEIEQVTNLQSSENTQELISSLKDMILVAMNRVEQGIEMPIGGKEVFLQSTETGRMYRVSTVDVRGGMELLIPSNLYIHGIQLDERNKPIYELGDLQIPDNGNLINENSISGLLGSNPIDVNRLTRELETAEMISKATYTNVSNFLMKQ
jgi:hypothetical protein